MSSPQNGTGLQAATSSVLPSGRSYVDSLIGDIKWGTSSATLALTYSSYPLSSPLSAYWAASNYSDRGEPSGAFGLTDMQRGVARDALEAWSDVANVSFTELALETTSNVGDIRFAWTTRIDSSVAASAAWAYYPSDYSAAGGDVWLSQPVMGIYTDSDWQPGGPAYQTMIHEVGHALGLKHPFEDAPTLGALDTEQYSVMSYTDHPHSLFLRISNTGGAYLAQPLRIEPDTPMLYDIAAIQYLYGVNRTHEAGDNTYTFDPATPFIRTLWDAGGNDTISVANFTKGCTLDLRDGRYSKVTIESDSLPAGLVWSAPPPTPTYDGTDNLAIAYGAIIENAVGGSGADTLIANDAVNRLDGGSGLDTAVFDHARSTVAKVAGGYTVSAAEGLDTVANIERVQFSGNAKVALDLDEGQAANATARLIGAAFGASNLLVHPEWVGVGLGFFDSGMTMADVAALVVSVIGSPGNADFVSRVYTNVVGSEPSAGDVQAYVGMLESGVTQAALLMLAANTQFTATRIDLAGLQQTGIDFV